MLIRCRKTEQEDTFFCYVCAGLPTRIWQRAKSYLLICNSLGVRLKKERRLPQNTAFPSQTRYFPAISIIKKMCIIFKKKQCSKPEACNLMQSRRILALNVKTACKTTMRIYAVFVIERFALNYFAVVISSKLKETNAYHSILETRDNIKRKLQNNNNNNKLLHFQCVQ